MHLNIDVQEKEIIIYYGSTAFIVGVVGGIFSTLIFVSLRKFRQVQIKQLVQ